MSAHIAWSNIVRQASTFYLFIPQADHGIPIVFTDWIPSLYPQKVGAIHRQRFFEMVHTESMACAIFLTYGFGRAAFELAESNDQTLSNDGDNTLSRYWVKYKVACLRMMRETFATSWPVSAKSLYFASVSLSGCAFIVNNPDEGRMHLRGAVNIAKALGGFGVLDELELEASLLWDIQIASLTGQRPVIEDAELAAVAEKLLLQTPDRPEQSRSRFCGLLLPSMSSLGQSDVTEALHRLFEATELLNSFSVQSEDKSNGTLVIRTLFAGYKLSICEPPGSREGLVDGHDVDLLESLRLAGMLVIYTTHLKATRKEHLFEKLSKDLQTQLRRQVLEMCWNQYPEIILWVFFVGAHASPNVGRTEWCIKHIREGTHSLEINNWDQVRPILKMFPYIDKEFDEPFEKIWNSSRPRRRV
jgi:hypothetical protein